MEQLLSMPELPSLKLMLAGSLAAKSLGALRTPVSNDVLPLCVPVWILVLCALWFPFVLSHIMCLFLCKSFFFLLFGGSSIYFWSWCFACLWGLDIDRAIILYRAG